MQQQISLVEAYRILDGFLGLAFIMGAGTLLIAQSRGKFAALAALAGKVPPALWLFAGMAKTAFPLTSPARSKSSASPAPRLTSSASTHPSAE